MELEEAIYKRKSVRKYKDEPVNLDDIEKLIQAGMRVPSAGAKYPLKIHMVTDENVKRDLCKAALNQKCIEKARICLVIAADYSKTVSKYHKRGYRYVAMEAGHAGQNISLMATSLGLGCVMIGAFRDGEVKKVLGIEEDPLYIIPIGKMDAV